MRYLTFTIREYRAISHPLIIDISKKSLIPIIGINECGKTTILHAIYAFDYYNDTFNQNLRHLEDTNNLYKLGQVNQASVAAEVAVPWDELKAVFNSVEDTNLQTTCNSYRRKRNQYNGKLVLVRDLKTKEYTIESGLFTDPTLNVCIAKGLIRKLPYILYFDDFRDSVPDKIPIVKPDNGKPQGWLAIVERLFEKTDSNFSVFKIDNIDERERKSIIAKVNKKLNAALSREWQNFKLDSSDALNINLEYVPSKTVSGVEEKPFVKFEIVENDEDGNDHYFYVRDRSKGFYWFFNFVMKLEFNPKVISNDGADAIYLLDEPGSYLHAAAQAKLCKKLKDLASKNAVVYCTHSHYLLDPDVIPINAIHIASKNKDMEVSLNSIYEHDEKTPDTRNAFQPIYDALQIKPFRLDIGLNDKVVLTEGIYDYYCYSMFINGYRFVPGQNADSILYYIVLMIGWDVKFNVIWDHDSEGKNAKQKADLRFGPDIATRTHLLPLFGKGKKTILQDLFKNNDLKKIREELQVPKGTSFNKTISALYYSDAKDHILTQCVSEQTKAAFQEVKDKLIFNK